MTAVAIIAVAASACSSVPNWANPGTWVGSSDSSSSVPTDSQGYPDVASVPSKPAPSTTPEERTQITNSLVADRTHAQYSADALRGGTEPAAAPPPPAAPQDLSKLDVTSGSDSDNASADTTSSDYPPAADNDSSAAPAAPAEAAPAPAPGASNEQPAVAEQQAAQLPAADQPAADQPAAAPTTTVVASTSPATSYSEPAVPVVNAPGAIPGAQPGIPADAPLGFKPSAAPSLDPSVAQFVPASVLARYRATQAASKQVSSPQPAVAPVTTTKSTKKKDQDHQAMATPDQGDVIVPAAFTPPGKPSKGNGGSVFVNLDAANAGADIVKTSTTEGVIGSAAWRTPGLSPMGVVFFPSGNVINAEGQSQIRAVVDAYRARGGTGYVRVVGHSSSRTGNMPLAEHIAYVFRQSQQHATAVAEALIREGIPANAVIVEAVGDTQPVYYESMPQGEAGNRRTEIFIEG